MTSKLKTDVLETVSGSGTIALTNQLSGMTSASVPVLTEAQMPVGSVLQVVQNYVPNASHQIVTSTSHVGTGVTASITPKFNNSMILVSWSVSMPFITSSWGSMKMYISTGGNAYAAMPSANDYQMGFTNAGDNNYAPFCFNGNVVVSSLDTLIFQPYAKSVGGVSFYWAHAASSYALTLTEIKQ